MSKRLMPIAGLFLTFSYQTAACASPDGVWVIRAPASWPEFVRDWIGEDYGISFVSDGETPCGKLSWIRPPAHRGDRDQHNPNPQLRTRKLLGLTILRLRTDRNGELHSGRLYFPLTGRYHSVVVSFDRAKRRALVKAPEVVYVYGPCPLCWNFTEITLEKRSPQQITPPIVAEGPCAFQ